MRTYLIFLLTHPGYVLSSFFYSPNIAGAFDEDFRFSIKIFYLFHFLDMGFSSHRIRNG